VRQPGHQPWSPAEKRRPATTSGQSIKITKDRG
jgi:hypothetical protein